MSHNQKLTALLSEVRGIAEAANAEDDFRPIFEKLKTFKQTEGPISYDNSLKWNVLMIMIMLGIIAWAIFLYMPGAREMILDQVGSTLPFWIGGYGVLCFVPIFMIVFANSAIDSVSDIMFEKDVYFDNALHVEHIAKQEHKLYKDLARNFGEFRSRGDENRQIEMLLNGKYAGTEYAFVYDYYVFRYDSVSTTVVYDSKGGMRTERHTTTHRRYGILLDFPFREGVAVLSDGGVYEYPCSWSTASEEFNRIFRVRAAGEDVAAKFLKPAVVLAFVDLANTLHGLNCEITVAGRLNIAFDDDDVVTRARKYSIASPEDFEEEIKSQLELPKLARLLLFVETLKKYNDSNFS